MSIEILSLVFVYIFKKYKYKVVFEMKKRERKCVLKFRFSKLKKNESYLKKATKKWEKQFTFQFPFFFQFKSSNFLNSFQLIVLLFSFLPFNTFFWLIRLLSRSQIAIFYLYTFKKRKGFHLEFLPFSILLLELLELLWKREITINIKQ